MDFQMLFGRRIYKEFRLLQIIPTHYIYKLLSPVEQKHDNSVPTTITSFISMQLNIIFTQI